MRYPNFNEEKLLWSQGYNFVVGLDEAGRGPLAGPVVACAVTVQHSDILQNVRMFLKIRDSKKLSEKQREYFFEKLTNHKNIQWEVEMISEVMIDKVNILEATKLAMKKAIRSLFLKIKNEKANPSQKVRGRAFFERGYLILDGNFKIHSNIPQKSVVRGDEKVFSCTAAGIIAKVTRDRIMRELHKKYPEYGFNRHKGYGTKMHLKNLKKLGPCEIHRKTFFPVSALVKSEIL